MMQAAASRCTMVLVLVLGWSCLLPVHAQQGSELAIQSLQQERRQLRELPLDESLEQRLEGRATPPDFESDFDPSTAVRVQIAKFNARLAKPDKLRPGQTERLTAILTKVRSSKLVPSAAPATRIPRPPLLYQEWLRQQGIANRECELREREAQADLILEQLPRILNGRQIRIYAHLEAQGLNRLRAEIRQLRGQAGLPAEIPTLPPPVPRAGLSL